MLDVFLQFFYFIDKVYYFTVLILFFVCFSPLQKSAPVEVCENKQNIFVNVTY